MTSPIADHLRLELQPITIREANAFVAKYHRHHKPPQGAKFAIGVNDGENVRGVVIVGRPVARILDNGYTAEVTRLCTDGAYNACSMLYGAAWRAARAMGYKRLITYILDSETGVSLKAANYRLVGTTKKPNWKRAGRPFVEIDDQLKGQKQLWEIV